MLKSGPFVLCASTQRLTKHGAGIALSSQPFCILELLMAAPDRIVTRAELKRALWPNSERIDTERRLNTAMRALREALNDTAETPLYVETVRSRGYRWIGKDVAAAPRARQRAPALAVAAVLCAIAACGILLPKRGSPPLTGAQQARYLRIVSMAQVAPRTANTALDGFLAERPDYAPARILDAALSVQQWRDAPSQQALAASRRAVSAAHAVAGDSANLATLDAELALKGDLDWRGAERRYRAALEREPGNVDARRGLAWLLLNAGRVEEALRQVETLLGNATLNDGLRADLGWLLLRARRPDLALSLCAQGGSLPNLVSCRHTALMRTGDIAQARLVAIVSMRSAGANGRELAAVERASPQAGYQRFLQWRAEHFAGDQSPWFQRAQMQAEAGQTEGALASLERAFATGDPSRFKLMTTPEFDSLRGDPRFQRLRRVVEST